MLFVPLILAGSGWALPRLREVGEGAGTFLTSPAPVAVVVLSGVAFLVALAVGMPRLTPLLPSITGLGLAGLTAAHEMRPELIRNVPELPGVEGARSLLELGLYLPLALALVVPLFFPHRWRGELGAGIDEEEYFHGLYDEDYEQPDDAEDRGGSRRR
ncbi:hypothetical protein [Haloactinospora alba]|uniref:hypothetical protein n=1 Tax=Haloactinospora alba TaxID=405555 RepID=UPI001FE4E7CB|nr:hypothetical protein [Haloactinospora alba]